MIVAVGLAFPFCKIQIFKRKDTSLEAAYAEVRHILQGVLTEAIESGDDLAVWSSDPILASSFQKLSAAIIIKDRLDRIHHYTKSSHRFSDKKPVATPVEYIPGMLAPELDTLRETFAHCFPSYTTLDRNLLKLSDHILEGSALRDNQEVETLTTTMFERLAMVVQVDVVRKARLDSLTPKGRSLGERLNGMSAQAPQAASLSVRLDAKLQRAFDNLCLIDTIQTLLHVTARHVDALNGVQRRWARTRRRRTPCDFADQIDDLLDPNTNRKRHPGADEFFFDHPRICTHLREISAKLRLAATENKYCRGAIRIAGREIPATPFIYRL